MHSQRFCKPKVGSSILSTGTSLTSPPPRGDRGARLALGPGGRQPHRRRAASRHRHGGRTRHRSRRPRRRSGGASPAGRRPRRRLCPGADPEVQRPRARDRLLRPDRRPAGEPLRAPPPIWTDRLVLPARRRTPRPRGPCRAGSTRNRSSGPAPSPCRSPPSRFHPCAVRRRETDIGKAHGRDSGAGTSRRSAVPPRIVTPDGCGLILRPAPRSVGSATAPPARAGGRCGRSR